MKLKYEAKKGARFKKGYTRCFADRKKRRVFFAISCESKYWFDYSDNRWKHYNDKSLSASFSNGVECHSVKAFRRKLRKISQYLPAGLKFTLVSRIIGNNVYGETK